MRLGNLLIRVAVLALQGSASPLQSHAFDPRRRDSGFPRNVPSSHVAHETLESHHVEGWEQFERAHATATLPMRIGLKQSNLDRGHDLLMDISNPTSRNYAKHLTMDEVTRMFAPPESSFQAVREWLIEAGIPREKISQSANKQWAQFDATVEEAEAVLFTKYYVYEHVETGIRNIGCASYHVPSAIQSHIDYITPGIKLVSDGYSQQAIKAMRSRYHDEKRQYTSDIASIDHDTVDETLTIIGNCSAEVTPKCVRDQYQIPNGTKSISGNELGVFQSLSQHYSQQDLDSYFSKIAPWVPNGSHPILRSINGAEGLTSNPDAAGAEADLDFQVAMPLIWPQKTILWAADDEYYQLEMTRSSTQYLGFFNTFFDAIDGSYCTMQAYGEKGNCARPQCRDPEYPDQYDDDGYQGQLMCGVYQPTNVISISYSGVEVSLPYSYMQRQCLEIMKLALQGVTVIVSSGDNGVGGKKYDPKDGCLGPNKDVYSPRTMSNCPYVLSVGATLLTESPGRGTGFREVAPTYFASGGGFSNVFATPRWQQRHVLKYLRHSNVSHLGYVGGGANYSHVGAEPGKIFNKAGRGYPDVAAVGDNHLVFTQGYGTKMSGTSVAVPIWASILNLVNEERLAAKKRPVGFVHQVLYSHPEVFTDVIAGSNPGCGSPGFQVRDGWDPVTGLGSPIYPKLLKLFLSLP